MKKIMGTRILFTGDSITDGNRYKEEKDRGDLNHQIGHSYAYVINAILGSKYPERDLQFVNRGISGNRVIDLYGRMYEDMVEIKPDIVSILVGINDGPQGRTCPPCDRKRGVWDNLPDDAWGIKEGTA